MSETGDLSSKARVVVCLSGRGDKDVETVADYLGVHPDLDLGRREGERT